MTGISQINSTLRQIVLSFERDGDSYPYSTSSGTSKLQLLSELRTAELIGLVVGLTLLLAGCAPIGPSLEILEGTEWVELGPVIVQSVTGRRAGADVNATGVFTQAENRMTLSLEFVLGPPPRFVRGTHNSRIGGKSFESAVSSESVTFLRRTKHRTGDRRGVSFRRPERRFEVSTSVSPNPTGPAPVTRLVCRIRWLQEFERQALKYLN